jgi:hypothetical protein
MGMVYAVVPQNAIALPKENPAVEFVESDTQVKIAQDTSIEYSGSWGLQDIGAELVHLSNYTGEGVKIAIPDTGVDYTQPTRSGVRFRIMLSFFTSARLQGRRRCTLSDGSRRWRTWCPDVILLSCNGAATGRPILPARALQ